MTRLIAVAVAAACAAVVVGVANAEIVSRMTFHSDFTFLDACSGEPVHVVGDLETFATSTVNDNTVSGTFHSVFRATGTGLVSGLTYQEVVVFNRSFNQSLENGQATVTTLGTIHVIAPGPDNDLRSPFFAHMTFNANGELVSTNVSTETECH